MRFKLKEYNLLQIHQKAVVVCNQSTLLDIDVDEEVIYTLYAYSGYYIEVQVSNFTKQLIHIIAFKNGTHLERYLDHIELPDCV